MATFYDYENRTALDPYTGAGAPNAVGQVFAKTDTTFSTPLTVVLMGSGLQATDMETDQYSQLPGFQVDGHLQVVFKSGDFTKVLNTTTPLVGPQGASVNSAVDNGDGTVTFKLEDGTDAATVALPAGAKLEVGTVETVAGSPLDAQVVADQISTPGTLANDALNATFAKRREVNVADYGAVGDWNGAAGTDNLSAFNEAATVAASSGQPSKIVIGPGDYWLSNNWLLDAENLEVECDAETVIRTTSATTTGATVTFMGHGILSPNNVNTPQRERFNWRGGKISATGSGTADNALGVVRAKNCHVANVTLDADRKGLTAQYGIDNITWERVVVTRAGTDAVTVETQCKRATLRDVHVVSTAGVGVLITSGDTGARCSDVLLDNVNVDACATGVSLGLTDRISLRKTRVAAASTQGLYVSEVGDLSIAGDCSFPTVNVGANVTHKKPRKQSIALANGWVAFGDPHDTPCAYRTTDGMVILDGAMKSGTLTAGTTFGTLPLGCRPAKRVRFLGQNAGGASPTVDIYIEPNGQMYFPAAVSSGVIVSLSGNSFPAA